MYINLRFHHISYTIQGLILPKSKWNMGKLYTSLFTVYKCPPLVLSIPISASMKVCLDQCPPRRRFASTNVCLDQCLPRWRSASTNVCLNEGLPQWRSASTNVCLDQCLPLPNMFIDHVIVSVFLLSSVNAECRILIVIQNVILLNAVTLNVVAPKIKLNDDTEIVKLIYVMQ